MFIEELDVYGEDSLSERNKDSVALCLSNKNRVPLRASNCKRKETNPWWQLSGKLTGYQKWWIHDYQGEVYPKNRVLESPKNPVIQIWFQKSPGLATTSTSRVSSEDYWEYQWEHHQKEGSLQVDALLDPRAFSGLGRICAPSMTRK